jgi:hypothetical protein
MSIIYYSLFTKLPRLKHVVTYDKTSEKENAVLGARTIWQ